MSAGDTTGREPWADASIPAGIDARRVYARAVATGGARRRRRRQRRVFVAATCVALAVGITGAIAATRETSTSTVAVQSPTERPTLPPVGVSRTTTTTIKNGAVQPAVSSTTNAPAPGTVRAGPATNQPGGPVIVTPGPSRPSATPTTLHQAPPATTPSNTTPTTTRPPVTTMVGAFVGGQPVMTCSNGGKACATPGPGNELDVALDGTPWASIDQVCFSISFARSNGLVSGDWLSWSQDGAALIAPMAGVGQESFIKQWCTTNPANQQTTNDFLDGHVRMYIHMLTGSATITGVSAKITGTP